jgi:hypothetical protein
MTDVFIGVAIVVVAFFAGWFILGMPGPGDKSDEE